MFIWIIDPTCTTSLYSCNNFFVYSLYKYTCCTMCMMNIFHSILLAERTIFIWLDSSLDSQSRRLLLSTISIIFFVTLLLVFSRCFLKESIRRRSFGNVSRPSWLAMFAENERNGNTLRSRSAMNPQGPVHDGRMYYRNSLVIFDVPPPYKPRDSVGEGEMELPLAYGTDAVGSGTG